MLRVYPSNKTENLAMIMAQIMKVSPLSDPFVEETVLIQSRGMGTWLQQQIATQLGIAANVNFSFPASFVWRLHSNLVQQQSPDVKSLVPQFEKSALRWEIFSRLSETLKTAQGDDKFGPLREYLKAVSNAGQEGNDPAMMFELSSLIADLFDAYQNYRADWLEVWERDQCINDIPTVEVGVSRHELNPSEVWQAQLWRDLYPKVPSNARYHRADQLQRLLKALEQAHISEGMLPERIFVFGLSALPPQWLPIFIALAKHCDVHILLVNPSEHYWHDLISQQQLSRQQRTMLTQGVAAKTVLEGAELANPLLASWGRLGRQNLSNLYQMVEMGESNNLRVDMSIQAYEREPENSALRWIQNDILDLIAVPREVDSTDTSIRFAKCHSRLREVEALRDYVLLSLQEDPALHCQDIIVMVPDIEQYSAFIEAVFSAPVVTAASNLKTRVTGQDDLQTIPYAISDQGAYLDHPLLGMFETVVNLDQSRLTGDDVLGFLAHELVRARLNISEEQLPEVRRWVKDLNIRWGLSRKHKSQVLGVNQEQDLNENNTWLQGMQRLLAGFLYGELSVQESVLLGLSPAYYSGTDTHVLIGKLLHLLELIEHSIALTKQVLSASEWIEAVESLWRRWFVMDDLLPSIRGTLDNALNAFAEQTAIAGFSSKIPAHIFSRCLHELLQQEGVSQRFLSGRINFCTLMPMRTIPFKRVCMLGMNEGEYPRLETRQSFDLMRYYPSRLGDRSRREDDRYLFLEALGSAREALYISYLGYDAKDNTARYPSVLVSELQEYCEQYFYATNDKNERLSILPFWTAEHRLQAFHSSYFDENTVNGLRTFSHTWAGLHTAARQRNAQSNVSVEVDKVTPDPQDELPLYQIEDLVRVVGAPLASYYRDTLALTLRAEDSLLQEDEPFSLAGLDAYRVKEKMLMAHANGEETDFIFQHLKLCGELPHHVAGDRDYADASEKLRPMIAALPQSISQLPIDLVLPSLDCRIEGSVTMSEQGALVVGLAKEPGKLFFMTWLQHLISNLQGEGNGSVLVTPTLHISFPKLSKAFCLDALAEVLGLIESLKSRPSLFLPKTAFRQLHGTEAEARGQFLGNPSQSIEGEADFLLWRRACLEQDPIQDSREMPDFTTHPLCKYAALLMSSAEQPRIEVHKLA
jgi:exodeoxyribonuclease V gamma subunit